jgi:hypothetical protein
MGVSGQRHAPAALLPPGKGFPVPIVTNSVLYTFFLSMSSIVLFFLSIFILITDNVTSRRLPLCNQYLTNRGPRENEAMPLECYIASTSQIPALLSVVGPINTDENVVQRKCCIHLHLRKLEAGLEAIVGSHNTRLGCNRLIT